MSVEFYPSVGKVRDENGEFQDIPAFVAGKDVAQATTDWLDEHIAQETGYVIDDSLTVAGAAADAKAVGDLKSAITLGGLYTDKMQTKSVSITGRKFSTEKNKVSVEQDSGSTSTTYICVALLGDNMYPGSGAFSSLDLSGFEFIPLDFDTNKYDLILTVFKRRRYNVNVHSMYLAFKNEESGDVGKLKITDDSINNPIIERINLSRVATNLNIRGNFCLFLESRKAAYGNDFYYWLELQDSESEFESGNSDKNNKISAFSEQLYQADEYESFLFFTDSHVACGKPGWHRYAVETLENIASSYKTSPVDFCLFGGDVLTNESAFYRNITPQQAVSGLAYNNAVSESLFGKDNYYPMIGNHDLNYLGTETISTDDIINASFRRWGKAYYKFTGKTTTFYVLDTGRNVDSMTDYRWEQLRYLAESLISDNPEHCIIAMHIIRNNTSGFPNFTMFVKANEIANAFNNRTSVTVNGTAYDFSGCTGRVEMFIGGHIHVDNSNITLNNIPCIMRTNSAVGYDLVFCDWTKRTVKFTRIGTGNDLTVDLDVA